MCVRAPACQLAWDGTWCVWGSCGGVWLRDRGGKGREGGGTCCVLPCAGLGGKLTCMWALRALGSVCFALCAQLKRGPHGARRPTFFRSCTSQTSSERSAYATDRRTPEESKDTRTASGSSPPMLLLPVKEPVRWTACEEKGKRGGSVTIRRLPVRYNHQTCLPDLAKTLRPPVYIILDQRYFSAPPIVGSFYRERRTRVFVDVCMCA